MTRPIQPIDASWANRVLQRNTDYLYRGYVIRVAQGSYDVLDPQRDEDRDEDGWGATVWDAMCVINEIVDGSPRRKA